MSKAKDIGSDLKLSDRATLDLLVALEGGEQVSQRGLAEHLGVALGLTNTLLKRVARAVVDERLISTTKFMHVTRPNGRGCS